MTKKFWAILLMLVLCAGLLPSAALALSTEDTPLITGLEITNTNSPQATYSVSEVRYSTDNGESWTEDTLMDAVWACYGKGIVKIELLADITLDGDWYAQQDLGYGNADNWTIDGKGYTIKRAQGAKMLFCVRYGSTVTLKNITIDGGAVWSSDDPATRTNDGLSLSGNNAHLIYVDGGATLILENGTILQNSDLGGYVYGAAVVVGYSDAGNGKLIMKDGAIIRNNRAESGGAVLVMGEGDEFVMQGGSITGNYAASGGGAVCINNGSFVMQGGTISGNASGNNGGGVTVNGTFTLEDGEITNNTSVAGGGGVTALSGNVILEGGSITGNRITGSMGGGILVHNGTLSVSGNPVVTGNTINGTTTSNVYLNTGKIITVSEALSSNASIGVTTSKKPTDGAPVNITGLNSDDYSQKFFSDNQSYRVINAENTVQLAVAPTYAVTVNNGTGSGSYPAGAAVTISADAPETGKQFASWTGADGLTFTSGSVSAATATFTMPAHAVEVTASYVDVTFTGITITTSPTRTVYTEGERFDPAGMVVTASYSDGSSKAVTGYTYAPNGALDVANTSVTISYAENGVTKTAAQPIAVNAKVNAQTPVITMQPASAVYTQGGTAAALTVTASVTDGGDLTYQWYSSTDNSNSGGTAISGAVSASYMPDVSSVGTLYYYCVVTNTNDKATGEMTAAAASDAATITVNSSTVTHTADITIVGQNGETYSDVHAKLMPLGSTTAIHDKQLSQIPSTSPEQYLYHENAGDGAYNLVVMATEQSSGKTVTVTTLIDLQGHDDKHTVELPEADKSSIVDDDTGMGIIAGNVEQIAGDQQVTEDGGHLEVKLTTAQGYNPETSAQDKAKIDRRAEQEAKTIEMALDIDLTLHQFNAQGNQTSRQNLGNSNTRLIKIMIPINTENRNANGFAVYRVHNGELHSLPYQGEYFEVDVEHGFITLYVKLFSSYAIGYGEPKAVPQIKEPAANQTVTVYEGQAATLSIAAENAVSYQWYVDYNDGTGWHECGDGTAVYTTAPVKLSSDGYRYYCRVSNADGAVDSRIFTLKVLATPALPETGDNSSLAFWFAALLLGVACTLALRKRARA